MLPALRHTKTTILDSRGEPFTILTDAGSWGMRDPGGDSPYKGASTFRRAGALFHSSQGSANADFLPWQLSLRSRSRHLIRNNPLAAGALQTLTDNAIGPGLRVHPEVDREILGLSDEEADRLERDMARVWGEWADSCECDLNRIQNFYDLQRLAFHSMLESGDILCLAPTVNRPGASLQTKVQLVEADRVMNPNFQPDTEFLAGGVELDNNAAPTAYHIRTAHPGDSNAFAQKNLYESQRVRAFGIASGRRNAWLLYERKRPQQVRGVPYLATVLEQLKQGERYTDQELQAAIVGGSFTVFVTSPTGGIMPLASAPLSQTAGTPAAGPNDIMLDYGGICDLLPGEDIKVAAPGRPNTAFDKFVRAIVEQMGAGIGIPYELMVKHFTASYSASRGALLEFKKFFIPKRTFFAYNFCSPFYELAVTEAVIRGRLNAPGFLDDLGMKRAYLRCSWRGPSQGQLNPLDEVNAAKVRMDEGITTREQETAELTGGDWESNHPQSVKETTRRRADGLTPIPTEPKPPVGVIQQSSQARIGQADQQEGY
jgi:lambda family phage portal protein